MADGGALINEGVDIDDLSGTEGEDAVVARLDTPLAWGEVLRWFIRSPDGVLGPLRRLYEEQTQDLFTKLDNTFCALFDMIPTRVDAYEETYSHNVLLRGGGLQHGARLDIFRGTPERVWTEMNRRMPKTAETVRYTWNTELNDNSIGNAQEMMAGLAFHVASRGAALTKGRIDWEGYQQRRDWCERYVSKRGGLRKGFA